MIIEIIKKYGIAFVHYLIYKYIVSYFDKIFMNYNICSDGTDTMIVFHVKQTATF